MRKKPDTRMKDARWSIKRTLSGGYATETAILAVLLDIRDELKGIRRNTAKLAAKRD